MSDEIKFTPWHFYMALDNHEPYPRKDMHGTMDKYTHPVTDKAGIRFTGDAAALFMKNRNTILLIDDGKTVEPYWPNTYNEKEGTIYFRPFPTSTNSPVDAYYKPIDWSNWMMGPKKAYHLKVRPMEGE